MNAAAEETRRAAIASFIVYIIYLTNCKDEGGLDRGSSTRVLSMESGSHFR